MTTTFLSHFTPSLMSADILEQMLVQRQELAQELVELIRESATTSVKHYTLLIGPRGIGKTHLISLIYHRVSQQENLRDRLLIAWLSEDNWSITSFLKLIVSIFSALNKEYPEEYKNQLQQKVENLYSSPETAEQTAVELLKDFIGDRTLLLLVENLDQIFDGLGDSGQRRFLAFLQQYNFCTIIATSPILFDGVNNKKSPFFNLFHIRDLQDLTVEDAAQLLSNVATIQGDIELKHFISSAEGKARIKAVHHLAGGNPRVYVIFSQFLTRNSLDELVEPFMRMLDDLTPYYQSRMQPLSPQQREILEFLCARRHAVSVKKIAERCFITHQTASSQLKTLRNMGYVTSELIGRDSYYELREVLMRFCLDVKKQRGETTIQLFVDFLRIWYTREELQQRLELGIADIRNKMGVGFAEKFMNIRLDKLHSELMELLSFNAPIELQYLCHALEPIKQDYEDPRFAAYSQEYENYFDKKDYVNALQITDKLIEISGSVEHWSNRGFVLVILGRSEEALVSFDKALEIKPQFLKAWMSRGVALYLLERNEEALASWDKAIELKPNFHEVWNIRGMALENLGRFEEALASLDKAIEFKPDYDEAWYGRGMALENLGRFEEALASLDKAIEFKPDYDEAWYGRGLALGNLGQFEEAIASLDKAIEFKPDYDEAWYGRGLALAALGRFEEALASYNKAIEFKPDSHEAWFSAGLELAKLGRTEEALASYNKAIEFKPEFHEAWLNRGNALDDLGRFEEALSSYDKAIEFKPGFYEAWFNRGLVLDKLGRFEEALASYDKGIELKPDNYYAWFNRGLALDNLEQFAEALASYNKAIELKPDDYEAWNNRAWVLLNLDRFEEALVSCDKAIELGEKYLGVFFNRVIAILGLNHWDEAITALDYAFQRITSENEIDVDDTKLITHHLFKSTNHVEVWRSRLTTLVNVYEKHNALSVLGQGLANNIPEIMSEMISDKAARIWLEVWQEQTSKFPEFQIPLRLLNAAVRYRETKGDRRALLELPIEERKLLQSILDLDQ